MTSGRVSGGFNQYGFTVGILMLDTRFPRIPGDMGNAATFPFPVRYHRVPGADPDLVVRRGAEGLLPAFVEGAKQLESEGVGAITTNCGFLVKFQRELAASVRVPVFTSTLLLVPLVHRMLPPGRRVGVMTVNAATLRPEHLQGAGIGSDIPIAIVGMETEKEFTRVLLGNELELDVDLAREEHVRVARRLVALHGDVGAIVLECTNMPPYAADVQRETGLPVFDIVSLVGMVHGALGAGLPPRASAPPYRLDNPLGPT
jgi:Asp/Glu/hydantoin racemase